ncbi:uncharacterized protein LOC126804161 [Argentina anserina]|uniref:uncharacterized protein LOC126804161 n=1 Tax=Argentina anserina TaxID=57926 RepID=UPI00217669D1|nr:uncharacterized protein LOC126804161 [Potentilla anserina]
MPQSFHYLRVSALVLVLTYKAVNRDEMTGKQERKRESGNVSMVKCYQRMRRLYNLYKLGIVLFILLCEGNGVTKLHGLRSVNVALAQIEGLKFCATSKRTIVRD